MMDYFGWLDGVCCGLILSGWMMWAVRRWRWWRLRCQAERQAEAILNAKGWQECGLAAFGLAPALAADNLPSLPSLPSLPPAAPEPESEPACARRYCPLCGGTPPGIAWLCGYHLARVRPARSVVLALPPIMAHPDGLTHDDLN